MTVRFSLSSQASSPIKRSNHRSQYVYWIGN